jgi:uroporphyrinogen decarboxylase
MYKKKIFNSAHKFHHPKKILVDYLAHSEVDRKLKQYFGCETEDELLDRLSCDFYYLSCRDISQNEGFLKCYKGPALDITDKERTCSLGIQWLRGAYDSKFSVDKVVSGPLENAETERDILRHRWPIADDFNFSPLAAECEAHCDRVVIGGLWTGIMGDSYRLYGFQNFLTNIILKPKLIKTLINKVTDVYIELNQAYFEAVGNKMDIWFFGNDFGSQQGLLLGVDMWYEFFFDNIKKLTSLAHSYGLKVMMHSCGAVSEIIPYLVEAGIDMLDPIQVSASGMAPKLLSKKFGGKIIFHGGIDTQQVLPKATIDEVRQHCIDTIEILSCNGEYIFSPSQILASDISLENIKAMYSAAEEYNKSKH